MTSDLGFSLFPIRSEFLGRGDSSFYREGYKTASLGKFPDMKTTKIPKVLGKKRQTQGDWRLGGAFGSPPGFIENLLLFDSGLSADSYYPSAFLNLTLYSHGCIAPSPFPT